MDNNYEKWEKLLKNQHKTMQMRKRAETYFVLVKAIFVSPFCTLSWNLKKKQEPIIIPPPTHPPTHPSNHNASLSLNNRIKMELWVSLVYLYPLKKRKKKIVFEGMATQCIQLFLLTSKSRGWQACQVFILYNYYILFNIRMWWDLLD